ncbi:MAG TPA: capsule biosynthesis protein [Thiobacillus sp.]|nr:capsule biosynthesis protein [Thiobacillus sp.]
MNLPDSLALRLGPASLRHSWQTHRLFWLTVVLPTLAAIVYFGFIAADVYISESRFVVRSPERQTASPLGALLKGSGFARSQDDSYTVQDFILSRDALRALDEKIDLRSAYAKGDIIGRFPGLDWDDSFENMHRYYQQGVSVQLDPLSSIATVRVRAFAADDAQKINQSLLEMGEALVNQLNERGRQDLIRFATSEVAMAEKKAGRAALALARYRNEKGVIDPEKQSAIPLQQVAKLQDELIAAKSQLAQLQMLTNENPQIPVLRKRIQMLETEIEAESGRVAGGRRSLASKAADFQRLALEKEFADRQLASALSSLEQARNEAQRQQLYLERIAQPSLPDAAMEPRRLRAILAVFVLGLIAWGVLSMLIASVKEHQD